MHHQSQLLFYGFVVLFLLHAMPNAADMGLIYNTESVVFSFHAIKMYTIFLTYSMHFFRRPVKIMWISLITESQIKRSKKRIRRFSTVTTLMQMTTCDTDCNKNFLVHLPPELIDAVEVSGIAAWVYWIL